MKGYIIVSKDEKSVFGREDADFYGAIWFYPDRAIAEDHCGPAGMVVELDITFPSEVIWSIAAGKKINTDLCDRG